MMDLNKDTGGDYLLPITPEPIIELIKLKLAPPIELVLVVLSRASCSTSLLAGEPSLSFSNKDGVCVCVCVCVWGGGGGGGDKKTSDLSTISYTLVTPNKKGIKGGGGNN